MLKNNFYIWMIVYKVLFEIVYVKVVVPVFAYSGLVYTPNFTSMIISYFIFIVLLILMPKKNKPSNQLVQLFFITTVVPITSYYWQADQSLTYLLQIALCTIIIYSILRLKKDINIKFLILPKLQFVNIINIIFIISVLLMVIYLSMYGGIDYRAFNFENVYDIREEIVYSGIWTYLFNWLSKVFIPVCMVTYFIYKRYTLFFMSSILQVLFYLSSGQKTILFSVFLIILATILLKNKKWKTGLPKLYSITILTGSILYLYFDNLMALAITPVRQFNLPARISYQHYNFFSENPKLYFSEGMIGKIFNIDSPYSIRSTYIISGGGSNANTGFLGDAYANGGLFVMIIISLIFALILLFVDSISRYSKQRYYYTALMVYPIITLNDGALLTTLSTFGLAILLIIMYFSASEEYRKQLEYVS